MSGILDQHGYPVSTSRQIVRASRDSGTFRGVNAGWHGPQVESSAQESRERVVMQRRADDLASNDWAANSALRAISDNAIGTGLVPQSQIPAKLLGIAPDVARDLSERMEWAFSVWSAEAHSRGMMHFSDMQYLGIKTMLRLGEMVHLPVMLSESEMRATSRTFSFALQDIDPRRLMTPADRLLDPNVVDGITLSESGRPLSYFVATPPRTLANVSAISADGASLFASDFTEIPARIGHHPGIFHLFRYDTDEQVRGVSSLSSGMTLFRNLNEAVGAQLFGMVIAACFPLFIATEEGGVQLPPEVKEAYDPESGEKVKYEEVRQGQILYGNPNEKPYVLESKGTPPNFASFVEIVTRAMSASVGIPYESLTKDFSKTNYSSARAALNEAWKLYNFYRQWFARMYCQRVWEMVMEEAYLRGMFTLPSNAPGFYEARAYWCNASWVGPARGFVDPVKEITATILALENRLMTYREAWAERGGEWKAAGNENEPLSDEVRAMLQQRVNGLHTLFRADVARSMNLDVAKSRTWAEGQVFLAGESQGLVTDIVSDLSEAVNLFAQESHMDKDTFAAQHPDLLAAIEKEIREKVIAETGSAGKPDTPPVDASAQAAAQTSTETLALVGAVLGEEARTRLEGVFKAGITAAQFAALAPFFSVNAVQSAPAQRQPEAMPGAMSEAVSSAEAASRAAILAGLQAAHTGPLLAFPGTVPNQTATSALLADAERRSQR